MWQCKYCKERFVEQDPDHICVPDSLDKHFHGRKALLKPLFNAFLQRFQKAGQINVASDGSFIVLSAKKPFAIANVSQDHIDICLKLPADKPISPFLLSVARLRLPGMTHYFILSSISDITPDIMRSLMWAKDAAE